jgi:hypothetical protein
MIALHDANRPTNRKSLSSRAPSPLGLRMSLFVAFPGFLMQLKVDSAEIVNNAVAIGYALDLTSGITGRNVELWRQSARVTLGRETVQLTVVNSTQDNFSQADNDSERNVRH